MNLLWRFVLGGVIVSLFALIGDVVRPKRFAGLFGGAPSVALATLALTVAQSGSATASIEARSMIIGSIGFVAYACVAQRLLASGRWPASWVSIGTLLVWAFVALVALVTAALIFPTLRT
jgi:hypothetical protein